MINDFASWLTPGQSVLIVSKDRSFRGTFQAVCGDYIVLESRRGDQHFIREELIESFTVYNRRERAASRETEAIDEEKPLTEASSETTQSDEEAIESLLAPLEGAIDKDKPYMYKPGDRIPLPNNKEQLKSHASRQQKSGPNRYPRNSADKPTLSEILDEIEANEDRSVIPAEDLLLVRPAGTIKMRENMKKYGFIEAFDEEKTNYWFPFNTLTDEDLSVTDEVVFCKGSNEKGFTASGIASPGTIHRLLLLVDYILKTRYYNFPIVLPLLETMREQYPDNKSIEDKYQEVKERQESYSKRKGGAE